MPDFRMPLLGADMESGTLVEWLVKPGESVKRGQIVAVVETEKGAVEVEIWEDGVIDELVVEPGTMVPVGEVLARLRGPEPGSGVASEIAVAAVAPVLPGVAVEPPVSRAPERTTPAAQFRFKVSPAARRLAQQLGVDLSTLTPVGPEGVIQIADVERAAKARPVPAVPAVDKQNAMRRAIAAAMAKSKREIPHYYLGTTIDVSRALDWLARENLQRTVKERILFAAVLLRAVALALHEVPELNGFWIDNQFNPSEAVHLGVGIALRGGGLIAPAIHDAQKKGTGELMTALGDLIRRARAGTVRSSELTDATITVTNLGEQGVETVFGVIYPPQVALVGFGKVAERPWAENGGVYVRRAVSATLCADHRASVGHRGALFLATMDRLLQEPDRLL
jgi:pyruvate dehydrogenase E2 component (dihydrolipoamide acetyltransferase)